MDYYQLLVEGPGDKRAWELFKRLYTHVVQWLSHKRSINEAEIEAAVEALEDLINPSWSDTEDRRRVIITKAETYGKDPSQTVLWELRKAVLEIVQAKRHAGYRRQIYSQVSRWVLILENEEILVSTTPLKRTEPLRSVLRLMRNGHSNEEIAEQLNANGSLQIDGVRWTPKAVSRVITQCGNPKKRIGLSKWGDAWLSRVAGGTTKTLIRHLPTIPAYRPTGEQKRNQPKLFEYIILRTFLLTVLERHGAALTLAKLAKIVESCISPPLFHDCKETGWPEAGYLAEKKQDRVKFSAADYCTCSVASCEEDVHVRDVVEKLTPLLTTRELTVFNGQLEKKSGRELARICGCAPGTIEKTRLSVQEKAARLDPVVRARANQIRAREAKKELKPAMDQRLRNRSSITARSCIDKEISEKCL